MAASKVVEIKILDRHYQIKCEEHESAALIESAKYLDQQMRLIQHNTKIVNTERVTVIAALNICHELLKAKDQKNDAVAIAMQQIHEL